MFVELVKTSIYLLLYCYQFIWKLLISPNCARWVANFSSEVNEQSIRLLASERFRVYLPRHKLNRVIKLFAEPRAWLYITVLLFPPYTFFALHTWSLYFLYTFSSEFFYWSKSLRYLKISRVPTSVKKKYLTGDQTTYYSSSRRFSQAFKHLKRKIQEVVLLDNVNFSKF